MLRVVERWFLCDLNSRPCGWEVCIKPLENIPCWCREGYSRWKVQLNEVISIEASEIISIEALYKSSLLLLYTIGLLLLLLLHVYNSQKTSSKKTENNSINSGCLFIVLTTMFIFLFTQLLWVAFFALFVHITLSWAQRKHGTLPFQCSACSIEILPDNVWGEMAIIYWAWLVIII